MSTEELEKDDVHCPKCNALCERIETLESLNWVCTNPECKWESYNYY